MPFARVSAWALVALLVCLWALYNRRIAIEKDAAYGQGSSHAAPG